MSSEKKGQQSNVVAKWVGTPWAYSQEKLGRSPPNSRKIFQQFLPVYMPIAHPL